MSIEITDWLRGLGLEQYALASRDVDIDGDLLRRLTAEDLRELALPLSATAVGCRMPSPASTLRRPRLMRQDWRSKLPQLSHRRAMPSAGSLR
jgi:hypothetical protein